jgi:hypothetical protein
VKNSGVKIYFLQTHKQSSKFAKFCIQNFVKYLSKYKFYKKYGNTTDSTENTKYGGVLCISIQKLLYERRWLMKLNMPEKWTYGSRYKN